MTKNNATEVGATIRLINVSEVDPAIHAYSAGTDPAEDVYYVTVGNDIFQGSPAELHEFAKKFDVVVVNTERGRQTEAASRLTQINYIHDAHTDRGQAL